MKDIKLISKKDEALSNIEEYKTVSGLKKLYFAIIQLPKKIEKKYFKELKTLFSSYS